MLETLRDTWFGSMDDHGLCEEDRQRAWFLPTAEEDEHLRSQFMALFEQAEAGAHDDAASTAHGCLALILVFDQLPRNFFRGTERAFASDMRAQNLCQEAMDKGFDKELGLMERAFLMMPLMHAEDFALQEQSVEAFEALLADTPESLRPRMQSFLDYAIDHRDVILRFGRFPHRNKVLGRTATKGEDKYLAEGGNSYGQG